jgi:hypothetical protein
VPISLLLAVLVLLVLMSALEAWLEKVNFKPLVFPIFLILFIMAAARNEGFDRDYMNYFEFFMLAEDPKDYFVHFSDWQLYEPTYFLIPAILKLFLSPAMAIPIAFGVYALLGTGFKILGIVRLSDMALLSLAIYFSNYYFLHELTQIRAGVASGIFLASIPYLQQKAYWKYITCIIAASLFHFSALVALPLVLLSSNSISKWIYGGLLMLIILLAFVDTSFVFDALGTNLGPLSIKTETYKELAELGVDAFGNINKLNVLFIAQFLGAASLLLFANEIQQHNQYAVLLTKIQIIGLLSFQLLSSIPALAFRVSEIFLVVHIVTFTFFAYVFRSRWVGFAIGASFTIGMFLLNLFYNKVFTF